MPRPRLVLTRRQLECLASPARREVVEALAAVQPATVDELAARLGRHTKSLYYHVRALAEVGLVEEAERRGSGRLEAVAWRVVTDRAEVDTTDRSAAALRARLRVARSMLRAAERLYEAALEDPDVRQSGVERELLLGQRVVRLRARDLRRVVRRMEELNDLLISLNDPQATDAYAVTFALAPDRRFKPYGEE